MIKYLFSIVAFFFILPNLFAQVTIGSNKVPEDFSVLELVANQNGGLRLPQLNQIERNNLRDKLLAMPETTPEELVLKERAKGLVIYNMSMNITEYWDGSDWRAMDNSPTGEPDISVGLLLNSQRLLKNNHYNNTLVDDVLEVSYSGGNGVYYTGGEKYTLTDGGKNLTLELVPGKLESVGVLKFKIKGQYGTLGANKEIQNVRIDFAGKTLGVLKTVGGLFATPGSVYSLAKNFNLANGDEFGAGGTVFEWIQNGINVGSLISIPQDGVYVFSFRLYGTILSGAPSAFSTQWIYISAFEENSTVPIDIAEINFMGKEGGTITYTVNLTVSGKAKDKFFFKISRGKTNPSQFGVTFQNGSKGGVPNERVANRTSMLFWKL